MKITVSVPAKIFLMGEHAVVYGRPALIAAVNRRLYLEISSSEDLAVPLKIFSAEGDRLILAALGIFQKAYGMDKLPPLRIKCTSQITAGSGLGSSAAVSAATIGALSKFVKNIWNPNRINELAYEAEKITHGNPSGADNTAVVFGGLVWYRKEFDFLKSIWSLPISSYKIPPFFLINTGRPRESTKEMVASVASFFQKNPKKAALLLNDQEIQSKNLLLSLKTGDLGEMKTSIARGERNLEKMGVAGKKATSLVRAIEKEGGVAKICGAGGIKEGSGVLLCYHKTPSRIAGIVKKDRLTVLPVVLGEEGIRIENEEKRN